MMMTENASLQPQASVEGRMAREKGRRRRIRLSEPLLLGLIAFMILLMALVYVGQRTYLMTLSYRAEAVERALADALREREFLQLEIAQAHSLAYVEQVATGRLGMVRPTSLQYVAMNDLERIAPAEQAPVESTPSRGLLALAVDWVAQHWPRLETAEAGGDRR